MITFALIVATFIAGMVAGVVILLRAGIAREESDHSLLGKPSTRTARATRRIVGLYVRTPDSGDHAYEATDRTGDGELQRPSAARNSR